MAVPTTKIWKIEPHTKAKHEILRRYLGAWFGIVGSRFPRCMYVDGFCGPGEYKKGEKGSPIVALEAAEPHSRRLKGEAVFWFIDEDEDRILHLREKIASRKWPDSFTIRPPDCGKFHEKFLPLLDTIEKEGEELAPTFAFIDPFGFSGIPLKMVHGLLKHRSCEAFINLNIDGINRFLEHPEEGIARHISETFGTEEVIEIANSSGDRRTALRKLYQQQLMKQAKFVRYFEMKDHRDKTQYYLFFATNDRLGHVKMKEAMWTVDPKGEFRFSDATDPNQSILFDDSYVPTLVEILIARFGGKTVNARDVTQYVEDETAFLRKHRNRVLKAEEERDNGKVEVAPRKQDGKVRKKGTFADGTMITFKR
jgi:three-Cys-motif partner protein